MSRLLSTASSRRGLLVVSLVTLVAAAGAAYWLMQGPAGRSGALSQNGPAAASTSGDADSGGAGILLGLARTAVDEKRRVAPAGANAFEFYLSVLQLDPDNKTAQEGLRQLLEPAADDIERSINNNELDEAERELALLREFDRTDYKLALLGGKLEAQRQLQIRTDEARAATMQAPATTSTP
jgi:protein TonB